MALNLSTVVLPRACISDAVQDGCQRLLTRNVIDLCVKFSKLKNFKAPNAETGCADACNRPPNLVLSPRPPRVHGTLMDTRPKLVPKLAAKAAQRACMYDEVQGLSFFYSTAPDALDGQ